MPITFLMKNVAQIQYGSERHVKGFGNETREQQSTMQNIATQGIRTGVLLVFQPVTPQEDIITSATQHVRAGAVSGVEDHIVPSFPQLPKDRSQAQRPDLSTGLECALIFFLLD